MQKYFQRRFYKENPEIKIDYQRYQQNAEIDEKYQKHRYQENKKNCYMVDSFK